MARPTKETSHLFDKRQELIWALDYQDYNGAQIGIVFNIDPSAVSRILNEKPKKWTPKWVKVHE